MDSSRVSISSDEKDEDENDVEPYAILQQHARYHRPLIEDEDEKEEEKEDLRNHRCDDDDHRLSNGHSHSQYDDSITRHDDHSQDDQHFDQKVAKSPPQEIDEQEDDALSSMGVASLPRHDEKRNQEPAKKSKSILKDDDDDDKSDERPDQLQLERARNSQVIRPGAVAVRGISSVLRSTSLYTSDSEEASQDGSHSVQNSHNSLHHHHHVAESAVVVVVVPEEDVENPNEELEERMRLQDEEQVEQFAAHVREAILQNTVEAEVVTEKANDETKTKSTEQRCSRWGICFVVGAILVFFVIVVVVPIVVTQRRLCHRKHASNNSTSSTPSTAVPATAPYSSCFYCLNLSTNLTSDFANETNLTIFGLLQTGLNHTLLPEFIAYAGLSTFATSKNFTLFAPLDISFAELPIPYVYYQSNFYWYYHLVTMLDYHIVVQPLNESEIFHRSHLPTLSGSNITVNGNYSVLADDAEILLADIPATNGYIQIPDRVLIPNELRRTLFEAANELYNAESGFAIFGHLFNLSGLEATLSEKFYFYNGLSLLLPTDAAFKKLDASYLERLMSDASMARDFVAYHLVPVNAYQDVIIFIVQQITFLSLNRFSVWFSGTDFHTPHVAYVNAIPIQESIFASDGLIHVLNDVALPPTIGDLLVITANVTDAPPYDFKVFVRLAAGPARLGSLLFNESDLITVASNGLTVFAPVQAAFDDGIATNQSIRRLLQNPSRWWLHVRNLLQHHCIAREIHNSELFIGTLKLRALSGFDVSLQVFSEGNVTNDDLGRLNLVDGNYFTYPNFTVDGRANVTLNKLLAVNGLVYGIDRLLLPPWANLSIYDTVMKIPELSTLATLIKAANLTGVLHDTPGLTLLAPNNTALSGIDVANATLVRDLVLSHILLDVVYFADFNMSLVESFNHQKYEVRTTANQVEVGGILISNSAILASNGVVQSIDGLVG